MQMKEQQIQHERPYTSSRQQREDCADQNPKRQIVTSHVMPIPVELLAAKNAQPIEIGDGRSDHAHQPLARAELWNQIRQTPAGHDVGGNVHWLPFEGYIAEAEGELPSNRHLTPNKMNAQV